VCSYGRESVCVCVCLFVINWKGGETDRELTRAGVRVCVVCVFICVYVRLSACVCVLYL